VTQLRKRMLEGLEDGATLRSLSSGGLRVLPRAAPLPVTL